MQLNAVVASSAWKCEHITPVFKSLHWPPAQHRLTFKILLLVHKALNSLASQWISDLLSVNNQIRPPRSSGADPLTVPRIRFKCAEVAFSFCGPTLWNKPNADLRSTGTNSKPFYSHGLTVQNVIYVCVNFYFMFS